MQELNPIIASWLKDPQTGPNITAQKSLPIQPPVFLPLPADMHNTLQHMLETMGIDHLYQHQVEAFDDIMAGKNIVLATGTASGKTLAYNLPVFSTILRDPHACALYLFPTKALTQDQFASLNGMCTILGSEIRAGIYDGDTPQTERRRIRESARIILTNPDMLHTGILPHHPSWGNFLSGLKFVIIDEMHIYRGVFGSHVANVVRRLKRVAGLYGAFPQFVLASATIGNPKELAERLTETPIHLIDRDFSGRGPRHFFIYNPPVVDHALGVRKSAMQEAIRLTRELMEKHVQTVVFARSRRSVELILKQILDGLSSKEREKVRGYRSGYLPSQRRSIEKGLRTGDVQLVVATNALELGIDIGGMGASFLVGYPGTVAALRQQAGRAGRGMDPALAILFATPYPLDQFLVRHPEFIFENPMEKALINPDHVLILLNHLKCAAFESPFRIGEKFGQLPADKVEEYLAVLQQNGEVHLSREQYYWMADAYPAASVSLRSASPINITLQAHDERGSHTIGSVDLDSALWMVHPHAIYLHDGDQFFVQELDLDKAKADLIPVGSDYYTEPLRDTTVQVVETTEQENCSGGMKNWGDLQITTQVSGFRKRSWDNGENLGQEPLDLPPKIMDTTGYWISIGEGTVRILSQQGLWSNAPNDYGPDWVKIRAFIRKRDRFRCQSCGRLENGREHDVHHKIPFRTFRDENGHIDRARANQPENLVTLCRECHRKTEIAVRVRSGLAGLAYALSTLAPLFLMCDPGDLGSHIETLPCPGFPFPTIVLYDMIPAGIGFSQRLYEIHDELLRQTLELIRNCPCADGCPSCVGPGGENGIGGKQEALAILREMVQM